MRDGLTSCHMLLSLRSILWAPLMPFKCWHGECSAYYRFLCFRKHQAINKLYPHIDNGSTEQLRKLEEVTVAFVRRRGNNICYASIRSTLLHAEHYMTLRQPRSQSQGRGRWNEVALRPDPFHALSKLRFIYSFMCRT